MEDPADSAGFVSRAVGRGVYALPMGIAIFRALGSPFDSGYLKHLNFDEAT